MCVCKDEVENVCVCVKMSCHLCANLSEIPGGGLCANMSWICVRILLFLVLVFFWVLVCLVGCFRFWSEEIFNLYIS